MMNPCQQTVLKLKGKYALDLICESAQRDPGRQTSKCRLVCEEWREAEDPWIKN
jgi:hypothetical protein